MSGYALKVLNDAKASLATAISNVEAQIETLKKEIDDGNADMSELDSVIASLTPPADPTEAQPA